MKKAITLTIFMALMLMSCAPKTYTGYTYKTNIFGTPKVERGSYNHRQKAKRVKKMRNRRIKEAKRRGCR